MDLINKIRHKTYKRSSYIDLEDVEKYIAPRMGYDDEKTSKAGAIGGHTAPPPSCNESGSMVNFEYKKETKPASNFYAYPMRSRLYNTIQRMDIMKAKVYDIHEEDHDIHRLRFHPVKKIMMEIGHKKHLGILDPNEPKKHISIKMPQKMDEQNFQNVVYPCCGLVESKKWGVQHNRCYGGAIEVGIIEASAQKCDRCGAYCGEVVQLIQHYEKHYGTANVQICALCHNPYITKAALDCHLTHNHGGIEGARHDYE